MASRYLLRASAPTSNEADASLAAWQARDMGVLYRQHVSHVSRWARRLGGPGLDVEDAVHDVFMVALRRLDRFDPRRAAFSTWLYGVTLKVVEARRRRERWRARLSLRWQRSDTDVVKFSDSLDPTGRDLERYEARMLLHRLLDRIGERYRVALVLFELEGLPCEDIAAITETSLENVYVRIHRGRKRLAAELRHWRQEESRRAPPKGEAP